MWTLHRGSLQQNTQGSHHYPHKQPTPYLKTMPKHPHLVISCPPSFLRDPNPDYPQHLIQTTPLQPPQNKPKPTLPPQPMLTLTSCTPTETTNHHHRKTSSKLYESQPPQHHIPPPKFAHQHPSSPRKHDVGSFHNIFIIFYYFSPILVILCFCFILLFSAH
jgi:hypothetical protein